MWIACQTNVVIKCDGPTSILVLVWHIFREINLYFLCFVLFCNATKANELSMPVPQRSKGTQHKISFHPSRVCENLREEKR